MTHRPVYWRSAVPSECQVTPGLTVTDVFVDGATRSGPWALMHPDTHAVYGRGLGVGRGQKYERQSDGKWLKIAG
jgi:hypothetical protein